MIEKKRKLAWLILARLVVVSLFLASITYFNIRQPEFFTEEMLRGVTRLIIVTYCFSVLSLTAFGLPSSILSALAYAQIVWEIIFVSILIILTGGITSTYPFFYNLAIINASFLFARREAFYTASLCSILYGAIIDFHYFGRLERFGLVRDFGDTYGANHVLSLIFTNILVYYLTALLTGYLAERARKSESALREKEIDFEELERLNSMIVSTLESGLVTINIEGKIRVFNRYASELTGILPRNAYDRYFSEIIPGVDVLSDLKQKEAKREINFTSIYGEQKILSVKSVPLKDRDGKQMGAIVDLQNQTMIKEMEQRLKKSDRLAAIGELSARIAHEIRNPLASISGSVQLIAEDGAVPEKDRKLLEIMLRETNRLEHLLKDFLLYARPMPPQKSWFHLEMLFNETIEIVKCDERFADIKIDNRSSPNIRIFADYDQFKQVFWNLLLNAAESMSNGGIITIESSWYEQEQSGEKQPERTLEITVSDEGSGISMENQQLMFEPFFTTKSGGSGLGLAMVYRIIDAHKGAISVESIQGKGTRFIITLPVMDNSQKG